MRIIPIIELILQEFIKQLLRPPLFLCLEEKGVIQKTSIDTLIQQQDGN